MRISRHAIPYAWACAAGFLACYFPLLSFRTPVSHQTQRYLLPSLPAARAIQQCASWRTDYYGHCVALGLASRRRSHVRLCRTYQRDLGVPLISLDTLTGYRSTPRRCTDRTKMSAQDVAPVSGVFPTDGVFHLLEIRLQAIQLSPCHADLPARRSIRLDATTGFLPCYCPRSPFGCG